VDLQLEYLEGGQNKEENTMDKPMSVDDKFLANMKKKHETKQKEKIVVQDRTMKDILGDITQVPSKLHMTGEPNTAHAKPKKPQENEGNSGKDMFDSTMEN